MSILWDFEAEGVLLPKSFLISELRSYLASVSSLEATTLEISGGPIVSLESTT